MEQQFATRDATERSQLNTDLSYVYRDADNYKQCERVVLTGTLTDLERATITSALLDGIYFVPSDVGLLDLQSRFADGWRTEVDHPWHELDMDAICTTTDAPTSDEDVHELAARFARVTWCASEGERGGERTTRPVEP